MRAPGSLQPVDRIRILVRLVLFLPNEDRGAPIAVLVDDAEDLDHLAVRMPEPGFLFRELFVVPIAIVHGERRGTRRVRGASLNKAVPVIFSYECESALALVRDYGLASRCGDVVPPAVGQFPSRSD